MEDTWPIFFSLIITPSVSSRSLAPLQSEQGRILINCSIHSRMPEDLVWVYRRIKFGIAPSQPPE